MSTTDQFDRTVQSSPGLLKPYSPPGLQGKQLQTFTMETPQSQSRAKVVDCSQTVSAEISRAPISGPSLLPWALPAVGEQGVERGEGSLFLTPLAVP